MSVKILFLSANPGDSARLKTDEERRRIEAEIRKSPNRSEISISYEPAVRPGELIEALRRHRPDVVHFGGHGSEENEIILESDDGTSQHVGLDVLVELFRVQGAGVRVVILNACYSRAQAEAITRHVDCAIGMSRVIPDATAVAFATAFYQGLAYGESVRTAFEASLLQIRLLGLSSWPKGSHRDMIASGSTVEPDPSSWVPGAELIERPGVDASKIVLVARVEDVPRPGPAPPPPFTRPEAVVPRGVRRPARPRRAFRLPFDREFGGPLGWALAFVGVVILAAAVAGSRGLLPSDFPRLPSRAWPLGAGLAVTSVPLLGPWLYRRSLLLRPDALRLRGDDPGHFRGREEDVERLIEICRDHPLTCLVGESGAGKSALLRLGLCRRWPEGDPMAPILIDQWGPDWVEGPREALNEAFRRFARYKGKFLLIFDQVDDYQVRHRGHFVEPGGIVWKDVAAVVAENPFWADLRDLIAERKVHVLLVTRSDASIGLDSLRIASPSRNFELGRLSSELVGPLLDELTEPDAAGEVVQDPGYGWDRLKARLARDLAVDGLVLPIQMKLALQALKYLDALTVEAYQAAGGLRGLEALTVDRQVAEVATALKVEKRKVLNLLSSLVDRLVHKTVPRPTGDLIRAVAPDDPTSAGPLMTRALEMLRDREVVRQTVAAGAGLDAWVLDHDYLCRGVIEAERRINFWSALLTERHRAFLEAGRSLRGRWESLLPPLQQAGLAYQVARGRASYAAHRAFAALSLVRFAPFLLALAAALVVWGRYESWRHGERARRNAEELHNRIAAGTPAEALDALWDLATSDAASRRLFLDAILASATRVRQLGNRTDLALQAALGLETTTRAHLVQTLARSVGDDPKFLDQGHAVVSLCAPTITAGDRRSSAVAAGLILTAMMRAHDGPAIHDLADALQAVPDDIGAEFALASFLHVLDLAGSAEPGDFPALALSARVVARRLPGDDRRRAADRIAGGVANDDDPSRLGFLAGVLREVEGDADSAAARAVAARIVAAFGRADRPDRLRPLAEGMGALSGRFRPDEVRAARSRLDEALGRVHDPEELRALAEALAVMPGSGAATAPVLVAKTVSVVRYGVGPFSQKAALEGYRAAAGRLDRSGRRQARAVLAKAIADTRDPDRLLSLASMFGEVQEGAEPDEPRPSPGRISALDRASGPFEAGTLAKVLEALRSPLRRDEVERASSRIVSAMARTTSRVELRDLTEALVALPQDPSWGHAGRANERLAAVIGETSEPYDLGTLTRALRVLGGDQAPEESGRLIARVMASMEATDDPARLRDLAEALRYVPRGPAVAAANRMLVRLGEVAGRTIDDAGLDALAGALAMIADRADPRLSVEMMKLPTCVGRLRSTLLTGLDRVAGRTFGRDRWTMAAWAEQKGWDVHTPPVRPGRHARP